MLLVLLACGADEGVKTEAGLYVVEFAPTTPPLNTLFEITTTVRDAKSGVPVEDATLVVDATMPQHGHGMTTKPEPDPGVCADGACRHPGGRYVIRGMKFHMPGAWTLHFKVEGPQGADRVDVVAKL